MCGMFATIRVDNEIDLPHFPEEINRDDLMWQSKQGLDVYGGPYRITAEGRLERKQTSSRDKTDKEKQDEAEKWGFDSWDAYVQAYEDHEMDNGKMIPPEVDWEPDEDGYKDSPPVAIPREQITDEEWWGDISHHGTFEFHKIIQRDPIEYKTLEGPDGMPAERPSEYALDIYLEYEARFTKGDLTKIVFLGERLSNLDKPVQSAITQITEWQEWKEEQQ